MSGNVAGTVTDSGGKDREPDTEIYDCDSCGEDKPAEGGQHHRGLFSPASIDPPEETWICADCVARHDLYEEDRAEDTTT